MSHDRDVKFCDHCGKGLWDGAECHCVELLASSEQPETYVAQIDGDHYSGHDYQHWDWSADIGLSPMPYAATKYISRCRHKHQMIVDLQKGLSYVDKMAAIGRDRWWSIPCLLVGRDTVIELTDRFARSANLDSTERQLCEWLALAEDVDDLLDARRSLDMWIHLHVSELKSGGIL